MHVLCVCEQKFISHHDLIKLHGAPSKICGILHLFNLIKLLGNMVKVLASTGGAFTVGDV